MQLGGRVRVIAVSAAALGATLVVVGGISSGPAQAAVLPVTAIVRDFDHEVKVNAPNAHPDFERNGGGESGIVTDTLGVDGKPVYGNHPTGTDSTTGATEFNQWFRDDASVNRAVPVVLDFDQTGSVLTYEGNDFFPIDNKGWNDPSFGNAGQVDGENEGAHNFSFTMELHLSFTYDSATGQEFTFTGDDDVFVYFNRHLGIDLGGIHGADSQTVTMNSIAAAAGMTSGQTYPIDIFFAERHTSDSNFNIDANFAATAVAPPTTTTTTVPGATTTTSTTSTTSAPLGTTTTVPAGGVATTSTTRVLTTTLVRGGADSGILTGLGAALLAFGAAMALVDRHRYRGQHYLKN